MGRLYVINHQATVVAGAISIIQLKAGASNICKIHRVSISQTASTTSAQIRAQIVRKSAAATVTSFTPLLVDSGDGAAKSVGGVAATGITATVEGTDSDVLISDTFNALQGWLYLPTPEERLIVPANGIIALKFPVNPALTITAQMIYEEIGG